MSYPSSLGGNVVLIATPNVVVGVGQWNGNWTARLAEVTVSSSTGTRFAKVVQHNQWSASFPLDDPNFPEVLGFTQGLVIADMYFKLGASAKGDRLQNTTIESVNKVCNPLGDVVRVDVSGMGGDLTQNSVIP